MKKKSQAIAYWVFPSVLFVIAISVALLLALSQATVSPSASLTNTQVVFDPPDPPNNTNNTSNNTTNNTANNTNNTANETNSPPPSFSSERIAGASRIDTGVAIDQKRYDTTDAAQGALLCNAANPVDCLAASSLAIEMDAVLLLNTQAGLDPRVGDEIQRSTAPTAPVVVLGQTNAQSEQVVQDLQNLGYTLIERLGGATRIETSVAIAQKLRSLSANPIQRIFFASAFKGPVDALVSSSPAGIPTANGALTAVLLVSDVQVPDSVKAELAQYTAVQTAYAFGGTAVLSDAAFAEIQTLLPAGALLTRVAGVDRYETSQKAATTFFTTPGVVTLAAGAAPSGGLAVDALSGGPFAAGNASPILLVRNTTLPTIISTYLDAVKSSVIKLWLLGGTAAVSDEVMQAAVSVLGH
jgi:putative cell wall-binding protein